MHSTVVLNAGPARQLFRLIAADQSLSGPDPSASGSAAAVSGVLAGSRSAPGSVSVSVLNGGGLFGSARLTVGWLRDVHGLPLAVVGGNAPDRTPRTTLVYPPAQAAQARELAFLLGLPGDALSAGGNPTEPGAPMTLTLGDDFVRPGQPLRPPQEIVPPAGLQELRASDRDACAK